MALFVFSNLREQKFGLTQAWLRRLRVFHEAGWQTHVATIHKQPEIDETLAAWRSRGWLPETTAVHHYQRRDRYSRPSWHRPTDDEFSRDDRIALWLDWLVGAMPGTVVFADSPVTYAPVALMNAPFIGRVMTVHLNHRAVRQRRGARASAASVVDTSRYGSTDGLPKLATRFIPFAPRADVVVAPTQRQAEHLREDLPGVDVRVIPNIVDPPALDPAPERDRLRIVYLGRMDPVKRVEHAIRATGLAAQQVPGLHLDLYGRGSSLDDLLALRDRLGLRDVVQYRGFTDDPERVFASAGLSVLTAAREPFGLSVAESLAVGTPVAAYHVDYGPSELVVDGRNGRLVRSGSITDMAAAIVDLVSDESRWMQMSREAPRAVHHLGTGIVGSQWLELAAGVRSAIPAPRSHLVVEHLRVLRTGLAIEGLSIAGQDERPPAEVHVGLQPAVRLEAGPGIAGPPDLGVEVREVSAILPWPDVARWAPGAELTARDDQGGPVPVTAADVPLTVAVTGRAAVGLGPNESHQLTRVNPGDRPWLEISESGARAWVGGATTTVTQTTVLDVSLVGHRVSPAQVELAEVASGIAVRPPVVASVVARADGAATRVGTLRVPAGGQPAGSVLSGHIEWDLAALEGLSAAPGPYVLGLAGGRTLRPLGTIMFRARGPRVLRSPTRWLLAPGSEGHLLLVRGHGIRARVAWVRRRRVRTALP